VNWRDAFTEIVGRPPSISDSASPGVWRELWRCGLSAESALHILSYTCHDDARWMNFAGRLLGYFLRQERYNGPAVENASRADRLLRHALRHGAFPSELPGILAPDVRTRLDRAVNDVAIEVIATVQRTADGRPTIGHLPALLSTLASHAGAAWVGKRVRRSFRCPTPDQLVAAATLRRLGG